MPCYEVEKSWIPYLVESLYGSGAYFSDYSAIWMLSLDMLLASNAGNSYENMTHTKMSVFSDGRWKVTFKVKPKEIG